jgi:type II secretory pathway component PulC
MRTSILCPVLLALLLSAPLRAETCRSYQLVDNDTGERVEGCAPLSVSSNLSNPLQVVPALHDKVRFGWKIASLTRGDLLARMGLRPGDVLLMINGHDLAARADPAIIAEALAGSDTLVVTVGSKPRSGPPAQAVQVMEVTRGGQGIKLDVIPDDGFFATIGLQPGDTVLKIGGQSVTDMASLLRLEKEAEAMPEVHVLIRRGGKELDLLVKTQ